VPFVGSGVVSHWVLRHTSIPSLNGTYSWSRGDRIAHGTKKRGSVGSGAATVTLTTSLALASNFTSSKMTAPPPASVSPHAMEVLAASAAGAHSRTKRRVARSGSRRRSFDRKELTRYVAPTQLQGAE
jgi:hypothetical protein